MKTLSNRYLFFFAFAAVLVIISVITIATAHASSPTSQVSGTILPAQAGRTVSLSQNGSPCSTVVGGQTDVTGAYSLQAQCPGLGQAAVVVNGVSTGVVFNYQPSTIFTGINAVVATMAPTITSINPPSGPAIGNIPIQIFGTGFVSGGTNVYFGNIPSVNVTVVSSTLILAYTVPGYSGASVGVVVQTVAGNSVQPFVYTYDAIPPFFTSIAPNSGVIGSTTIITGGNFDASSNVFFNGVPALSVRVLSVSTLQVVVPAGTATASVKVTTNQGITVNTGYFFYQPVVVPTPTATTVPPTATPTQLTVAPPAFTTYQLNFRWNLVVYQGADGQSVGEALRQMNDVTSGVTAIYFWNASTQEWRSYFPSAVGLPGVNDFNVMTHGRVYWIAVNHDISWTVRTN